MISDNAALVDVPRRMLLHGLPVASMIAALGVATQVGDVDTARAAAVTVTVASGWVLALLCDDLFGYDAQIDLLDAPRMRAGAHPLVSERWRTRHAVLIVLACLLVMLVAGQRLSHDAPSWWWRLGLLGAVLALAPSAPYLRARRRALSEVCVAIVLGGIVPALVIGAAVGMVPLEAVVRCAPIGVAAGAVALDYTASGAAWDLAHRWWSLPARLGAGRARRVAAAALAVAWIGCVVTALAYGDVSSFAVACAGLGLIAVVAAIRSTATQQVAAFCAANILMGVFVAVAAID